VQFFHNLKKEEEEEEEEEREKSIIHKPNYQYK
jgi:hypothetical protein